MTPLRSEAKEHFDAQVFGLVESRLMQQLPTPRLLDACEGAVCDGARLERRSQ